MEEAWMPPSWKAHPQLVAQFNALQETANRLLKSKSKYSWQSRHSTHLPTSGRGVKEYYKADRDERYRQWIPQKKVILDRHQARTRLLSQIVARLQTPTNASPMITIQVRFYSEDGVEIRRRSFVTPSDLIPPELLQTNGFLKEDREYSVFTRVIYALSLRGNAQAEMIMNMLGNTMSGLASLVLRQEGDPRPFRPDPFPQDEVPYGIHTIQISHPLIPSKVLKTADGWEFVPSETLSESLLTYFQSKGQIADDCMDQAILSAWKPSWDKWVEKHPRSRQYTMPLTYELIQSRTEADHVGGRKNLKQLEKFLTETNLSCVVFNVQRQVIWKHIHDGPRPSVSPDTLYLVATNNHLYRVPQKETYTASHFRNDAVQTSFALTDPKTTYGIPPDQDHNFATMEFCDTTDEVLDAIWNAWDSAPEPTASESKKKDQVKSVDIHTSVDLANLLFYFIENKDFKPELNVYEGEVRSLRVNLTKCVVSIRKFNVEGETFDAIFEGVSKDKRTETIRAYIKAFTTARPRLIHRYLKSDYSVNLQHVFETYKRGPLMRNFVTGPKSGIGVDIRSAYPFILKELPVIPVFKSVSEFQEWNQEPIEDYAIYMVENAGTTSIEDWFCLDQKFNLVSGWTLKQFFAEGTTDVMRSQFESEYMSLCEAWDLDQVEKKQNALWKATAMDRIIKLRELLDHEFKSPNYKIIAWIRPVHLAPNPFEDILQKMVDEVGNWKLSKFGLNAMIGLTSRRRAEKSKGNFTFDYDEAKRYATSEFDIQNFGAGYLYFLRSRSLLMTDGFYPIQFLVHDRLRVSLLQLYKKIVESGRQVIGLRVDCFIVNVPTMNFDEFVEKQWTPMYHSFRTAKLSGADATPFKQKLVALWKSIQKHTKMPEGFEVTTDTSIETMGLAHIESSPKTASFGIMEVRSVPPPHILEYPSSGRLSDLVEFNKSSVLATDFDPYPVWVRPKFPYKNLQETFDYFGETTRKVVSGTMVLGAVAGSGKTSCCRRNARGKVLAIVPTHKRIHEFKRDFEKSDASWKNNGSLKHRMFSKETESVECMTLAKFVGRNHEGENTEGKMDVSEFDTIIVDEFFQSDYVDMISAIKVLESALDKPKVPLILGNGDTFQLKNHKVWNNILDEQAFFDEFMWRVFPNRVFLATNWRLELENDRNVLMAMLKEMKEKVSPYDVIVKPRPEFGYPVGLIDQLFTDLNRVIAGRTKPMQCLTLSNQVGNVLNRRFAGPERPGMMVIGKSEKEDFKEAGCFKNELYEVKELQGTNYLIHNKSTGKDVLLPSLYFRRDVSWTAHSVQGETIEDDYAIFEAFDYFADWKWFYTAFSRAKYLRNVWIYNGESFFDREFLNNKIKTKLKQCKEYDKQHKLGPCDLTESWFKEKFKDQNFSCAECSVKLAFNWSETDETRMLQFSPNRMDNHFGHVKRHTNIVCLRCQNASSHD